MDIQRDGNKDVSPVLFLEQYPVTMLTKSTIIEAQVEVWHCRNSRSMVGIAPVWVYDDTGSMCRKPPIDGSSQKFIQQKYRAAVIYNAHYPKLAEHSGVRRMYDFMRKQSY